MMQENLEKTETTTILVYCWTMIFLMRLLGACVRNVHCKHQSKHPQTEHKTAAQDQASEHKKTCGSKKRLCGWRRIIWGELKSSSQFKTLQCCVRRGLETLKLEANFALEEQQGTSNASAVMCTLTSSGDNTHIGQPQRKLVRKLRTENCRSLEVHAHTNSTPNILPISKNRKS